MTPDMFNAFFEFAGAAAVLGSLLTLIRDKQVKGVHWGTTAFFTSWSLWNTYYYPSLGQWWSFAAGVLLGLANCANVALMLYYIHKEK